MKVLPKLQSQVFEQLVWDQALPEWPTLNAVYRGRPEVTIEVAMVGKLDMPLHWVQFLQRSEAIWHRLLTHEERMLKEAAPEIHRMHRAYFGERWKKTPLDLISELSLRLVCFYTDGSAHLWYSGTGAFNHLDVDLGLNADLMVTEVRFDG